MPLITPFFRLPWRRRRAHQSRMAILTAAVTVLGLVLLPLYVIYKPPVFLINQLQHRYPQVLFHIPTNGNVVALTIDDAPSDYSRQILDILEANEAKATFFTIGGQVSGREDVLRTIVRSGHELGNHAMHDEPSIRVPSERLKSEIEEVDGMIQAAYEAVEKSRTMKYFRPGSGIFSDRILDIAEKAGYRTILGSIYPHDPFIPHWRINAWHILSSLRPGAVIICHDRRPWTVPMLKKVIPEIKRRGYRIVTVSGLLDPSNQT
jgi:peptidoglycan/xylan/chitin deacetylase (PgdA/CDA1 family)